MAKQSKDSSTKKKSKDSIAQNIVHLSNQIKKNQNVVEVRFLLLNEVNR